MLDSDGRGHMYKKQLKWLRVYCGFILMSIYLSDCDYFST